jgi:hypothetical protein
MLGEALTRANVGTRTRMRCRLALLAVCLAAIVAAVPATQAATTWSCGSVKNPYPGTRYAGVDLSRITAKGVSCATAKRVAKSAHKKALGLTPPPSGVRTLTWDGWKVTGDLRRDTDKYVASKGSKRVRWRF